MIELTVVGVNGSLTEPHKISIQKAAIISVRDLSIYNGRSNSEIYTSLFELAYSEDDSQVSNSNVSYEILETREHVLGLLKSE